jgi:hypothetical protein
MFENGVLREISGAEREFRKLKRTANWVSSLPNIITVIKWKWGVWECGIFEG